MIASTRHPRSLEVFVLLAMFGLSTVVPAAATSDDVGVIRNYCAELDKYVKAHEDSYVDVRRDRGPNNDGNGPWRLWPKGDADEPVDSNSAARCWRRNGKLIFVLFTIQSDSRDWALFVSNYYRPDGTLAKLESQLNTFYGNVTVERDWLYGRDGSVVDFRVRYFKIGTRQRARLDIDFQDETVPLYQTVEELPFRRLLRP